MKIITELTLDLSRQGVQASVPISQHDAGARRIIFHLRNGGKPIKLEANDTAVLYIAGDRFEPLTVYTENGAYPNSIVYDIAPNASSQAGAFLAQIQIYQADENITFTPEFMLLVSEDKTNGSHVLESPQYAAVIKAQLAAAASASDAEAAAERAKEAAESVNEAFIRYSADADPNGAEFTETRSEGQDYIGFATGQTAPTEKGAYTWAWIGDKVIGFEDDGNDLTLNTDKSIFLVANNGNSQLSILGDKIGYEDGDTGVYLTMAQLKQIASIIGIDYDVWLNNNPIRLGTMQDIQIETDWQDIRISRAGGDDELLMSSDGNVWFSRANIGIESEAKASMYGAMGVEITSGDMCGNEGVLINGYEFAELYSRYTDAGFKVCSEGFVFQDKSISEEPVKFTLDELRALKSGGSGGNLADIDTALDAIIAIQESLMGVSE